MSNLKLTEHQRRAIDLAERIVANDLTATELLDSDWALLMLAAGVYRVDIPLRLMACKVLTNLTHGRGYFASSRQHRRSDSLDDSAVGVAGVFASETAVASAPSTATVPCAS